MPRKIQAYCIIIGYSVLGILHTRGILNIYMDHEYILESKSFLEISRTIGNELVTDIGHLSSLPNYILRLEEKESKIWFSCFTERVNEQHIDEGVVVVTSNFIYILSEIHDSSEATSRKNMKRKFRIVLFDQTKKFALPNPIPLQDIVHYEVVRRKRVIQRIVLYNCAFEPFCIIKIGEIEQLKKKDMDSSAKLFQDATKMIDNMVGQEIMGDLGNLGADLQGELNNLTAELNIAEISKGFKLMGKKKKKKSKNEPTSTKSDKNSKNFVKVLEALYRRKSIVLPVIKPPLRNREGAKKNRPHKFSFSEVGNSGKQCKQIVFDETSHLEVIRIKMVPGTRTGGEKVKIAKEPTAAKKDDDEKVVDRDEKYGRRDNNTYVVEFGFKMMMKGLFKKKLQATKRFVMNSADLGELLCLGVLNSQDLARRDFQKLFENSLFEYQRHTTITPLRFNIFHASELNGKKRRLLRKGIKSDVNRRCNFCNVKSSNAHGKVIFSSEVNFVGKVPLHANKIQKPKSMDLRLFLSSCSPTAKPVIVLLEKVQKSHCIICLREYDFEKGFSVHQIFSDIRKVKEIEYFPSKAAVSLVFGKRGKLAKRINLQFSSLSDSSSNKQKMSRIRADAFVQVLRDVYTCHVERDPFCVQTIEHKVLIHNDLCSLFSSKFPLFIKGDLPYFSQTLLELDKYLHWFYGVNVVFICSEFTYNQKRVIFIATDTYLFIFRLKENASMVFQMKYWNENLLRMQINKKSKKSLTLEILGSKDLKLTSNVSEIELFIDVFSKCFQIETYYIEKETIPDFNDILGIIDHGISMAEKRGNLGSSEKDLVVKYIRKIVQWSDAENEYKLSKYLYLLSRYLNEENSHNLTKHQKCFLDYFTSKREKIRLLKQIRGVVNVSDFHSVVERMFYYSPLNREDFLYCLNQITSLGENLNTCFLKNEGVASKSKMSLERIMRMVVPLHRLEKLNNLLSVNETNEKFETKKHIVNITVIPSFQSFVHFYETVSKNEGLPEKVVGDVFNRKRVMISQDELWQSYKQYEKLAQDFERLSKNCRLDFSKTVRGNNEIIDVMEMCEQCQVALVECPIRYKSCLIFCISAPFSLLWEKIMNRDCGEIKQNWESEIRQRDIITQLLTVKDLILEQIDVCKRKNFGEMSPVLKQLEDRILALTSSKKTAAMVRKKIVGMKSFSPDISTEEEEEAEEEGGEGDEGGEGENDVVDYSDPSVLSCPQDLVAFLFDDDIKNDPEFVSAYVNVLFERSKKLDGNMLQKVEPEEQGAHPPVESTVIDEEETEEEEEVDSINKKIDLYMKSLYEVLSKEDYIKMGNFLEKESKRLVLSGWGGFNVETCVCKNIGKFNPNTKKIVAIFTELFWQHLKIDEVSFLCSLRDFFHGRNVHTTANILHKHYLASGDCMRLNKFITFALQANLIDFSVLSEEIIDPRADPHLGIFTRLVNAVSISKKTFRKRDFKCIVPNTDLIWCLKDTVYTIVNMFRTFSSTTPGGSKSLLRPNVKEMGDIGNDFKNPIMYKVIKERLNFILFNILSHGTCQGVDFWNVIEENVANQMGEANILVPNLRKFFDMLNTLMLSMEVYVPSLKKLCSLVLWLLDFGCLSDFFEFFSQFIDENYQETAVIRKHGFLQDVIKITEKLKYFPFVLNFSREIVSSARANVEISVQGKTQ